MLRVPRPSIPGLLGAVVILAACAHTPPADQDGSAQPWQTDGRIQVMDDQTWVVGSQLVTVPPRADVAGTPRIGVVVHLSGTRTAAGELRADRVEVVDSPSQPSARPATTPTPPPTARPAEKRVPAPPAHAPARRQGSNDERDGD